MTNYYYVENEHHMGLAYGTTQQNGKIMKALFQDDTVTLFKSRRSAQAAIERSKKFVEELKKELPKVDWAIHAWHIRLAKTE